MFDGIKRTWRDLENGPAGERFKQYHHRHVGGPRWQRILRFAGGIVIIAIGLVGLPAPGPGLLIIAVGAGLLTRESAAVASGLDWTELRLRRLVTWGHGVWSKASAAAKIALGLIGLVAVGATAILVYTIVVRG